MNEPRYRRFEAAYWESEGVEPEERWLELPQTGTTARIQIVGDGPPLLFLHGTTNNGTSWAPLARRLADRRCLLVDRPGCGLSEPLSTPLATVSDLEQFAARFAVEVLDSLDIDRAPVVSTSLGGYLALHAAIAHPDRISSVIELGWTGGAPMNHLPLVMRLASARPIGLFMSRLPAPERAVRSMLAQVGLRDALASGRVPQAFVEWFQAQLNHTDTLRNELTTLPPVITPRQGMNPDMLFDDGQLGSISVPTHFLWGTDDVMGGADIARQFSSQIPHATLDLIDGGGHAVWLDDPDDIATRVDHLVQQAGG